jgi:L-asparaginase II
MTNNPVFVEVSRGHLVESRHRGAICVIDGDGHSVINIGDTTLPVFPRSAIKAVQALPLVESGAADAYGFGDAELSLACASHSGEPEHIALARNMLEKAGLDETCLECGGHWSSQAWVMRDQTKLYSETPPAICNNCSGKHTGFVCTAAHLGIDTKGYIKPDHQIMENVCDALQSVTGEVHESDLCGTDGCSIPTYAISLKSMAHGFARMATGVHLQPERAKAGKRLLQACMAEPFYMAGTNRFCTKVMELGGGRLFAKTGAEGVFCAAIPELGLGIALKCDDGASRASEAMMAATFAHLLPKDDDLQAGLLALANIKLTNWNGMHVGDVTCEVDV